MATGLNSHAGNDPVLELAADRIPDPPYAGIRPFEENEWPIFFGRQAIIEELLERLSGRRFVSVDESMVEERLHGGRFVAIIGASGGGKSSLVKAGLFSTLKHKHKRLGIIWRTATMRPGGSPMWSLAEALYRTLHASPVEPNQAAPADAVEPYRAGLARGRHAIAAVLREYAFPDEENLFLVVDQFEELFRYDVLGGEAEVATFPNQLVDVVDEPPEGFYLALMRSDFLGDCARHPRFADALNRASYLLRGMSNAELAEAIIRPADLLGGRIEPDLVERLIRDTQGEQDYLPLLQHALMWHWVRARKQLAETGSPKAPVVLDLQNYEALGGMAGVLSQHANAIYERLGTTAERRKALRYATRRLFQSLAEIGSRGRFVRRPLHFAQLLAETGVPTADLKEVIEAFREAGHSFLMPPWPQPIKEATVIDVSHEALIRQWDKLSGRDGDEDWLKEEQSDAELWMRLYLHVQAFIKNPRRLLDGRDIEEFTLLFEKRKLSPAWFQRYIPQHRQISAGGFQELNAGNLVEMIQKLLTDSQKRQQLLIDSLKNKNSFSDVHDSQAFAVLMDIAGVIPESLSSIPTDLAEEVARASAAESAAESLSSIPTDLAEEVARASAAESAGWLRLLASEVMGLRFQWPALRLVAQAQWELKDYDGARKSYELIRSNDMDDINANLALANIFERSYRLQKRAELLEDSNQAIARVLESRKSTAAQVAEAEALRARNLKTLWRLDFEGEADLAKRRKTATSRALLQSYEAYRRAYLSDLNHYWAGLAALQQGTVAADLAAGEVWQDIFDNNDQAAAYQGELTRQLEALRHAVSKAIEAALMRPDITPGDRVWAKLSAADLMFLGAERAKRVVQAYKDAIPRNKDAIPRNRRFVWDAAKGQLGLFAQLGIKAELANEVIQTIDSLVAAPEPDKKELHMVAGHRADEPGRSTPRFPASCEAKARDLILESLAGTLDAAARVHVLASAAPGSDILCHEICRELGIDSTICLPMPKENFARLAFGGLENWRARFLSLVSSRPVIQLSVQADLPRWLKASGLNPWERANRWVLEMAQASGAARVTLIALWDGKTTGDAPGGTAHMVKLARDAGTVAEVLIDASSLVS
jgi:hypothetical protein